MKLTIINMEMPVLTIRRCCVSHGWWLAQILRGAHMSPLQLMIVDVADFYQCWVGG